MKKLKSKIVKTLRKYTPTRNLEKEKGITLIALVITIIILLILAGITIGQLTGNGLFGNAKLAKEKYENVQEEENAILGDYENQIDNYVDNARETTGNLENSKMKLLTTISNNESKAVGTYDMSKFDRTEKEICNNYIEYDSENNFYIVKKSGWYIIDMNAVCAQLANHSDIILTLVLNEDNITTCYVQGQNNSTDSNSKTLTLYLTKNDKISCNKKIQNNANNNWNQNVVNIWTMDK